MLPSVRAGDNNLTVQVVFRLDSSAQGVGSGRLQATSLVKSAVGFCEAEKIGTNPTAEPDPDLTSRDGLLKAVAPNVTGSWKKHSLPQEVGYCCELLISRPGMKEVLLVNSGVVSIWG